MKSVVSYFKFLYDVALSFVVGASAIAFLASFIALICVAFQYFMHSTGLNAYYLASSVSWLLMGMIFGFGILALIAVGDDIREYLGNKIIQ